jgi:hypothetical protein
MLFPLDSSSKYSQIPPHSTFLPVEGITHYKFHSPYTPNLTLSSLIIIPMICHPIKLSNQKMIETLVGIYFFPELDPDSSSPRLLPCI